MGLETPYQVSKHTIHQLSQPYSMWIEAIDYDKIPDFGIYLFIDQLLKNKHPNLKHIKLADRLLQKNSPVSFSIHPSVSANPRLFISGMVDQATKVCHKSEYAKRLKDAVQEFQVRWSRESFSNFAQSWSLFTNYFLQEKVAEKLRAV